MLWSYSRLEQGDKIGDCGVSRPFGLGGLVAYQPGISDKLVRRCWVVIYLCHGGSPGTSIFRGTRDLVTNCGFLLEAQRKRRGCTANHPYPGKEMGARRVRDIKLQRLAGNLRQNTLFLAPTALLHSRILHAWLERSCIRCTSRICWFLRDAVLWDAMAPDARIAPAFSRPQSRPVLPDRQTG